MSARGEVLERIEAIDMLPGQTTQLISMLQNPEVDINEVSRVISCDASLTADVLKIANSVMFGGRVEVCSTRAAFLRLGASNLLTVLLSNSAPMMVQAVEGYGLEPGVLWERSLTIAIACEELAAALGVHVTGDAYTAGLLCDVGKLLIGPSLEAHHADVEALVEAGFTHDRAEREVLNIDHAEAGALLLERWGLPASIVAVVRWHHRPDECPREQRDSVELVHVAEHLCMAIGVGVGTDGMNYATNLATAERLQVRPEALEIAMASTFARLTEVREQVGPTQR